jgi:hypothetical protein
MATPEEIQAQINSLSQTCETAEFLLAAAQTNADIVHRQFSVCGVNDLPDLQQHCLQNQIVLVESVGVPVIATVNQWIGLDGRVLRRDFDVCQLWAWGDNFYGQLGDGTVTDPLQYRAGIWLVYRLDARFQLDCYHTAAVKTSGTLWAWGYNVCGQIGDGTTTNRCSPVQEICSATDWAQVSAGCAVYNKGHTAALKSGGTLWAWGNNTYGQSR